MRCKISQLKSINRIVTANILFHLIIGFMISLALPNRINSQNSNINFEHFSVAQGISSPVVSCILQDREGYMWYGTFNSIDKYDGYTFTSFKHESADTTSLNNGYVQSIYEDRAGNIWVGTSQGLDKLNRTTEKFSHYFPIRQDIAKEGENHVWSIYEDKEGQIWVVAGETVYILNRSTGTFSHFVHNSSDLGSINKTGIGTICDDTDGSIWIATGNGVDKFDKKNQKFVHYWYEPKSNSDWTNHWVNTIFKDRSGILWLGTRLGLVSFNKKDSSFVSYGKELQSISSICEDESGILWIGTWLYGLFAFNKTTKNFTNYSHNPKNLESLSHNQVSSVCSDKSGTLWIGTWGGGVNKLDKFSSLFVRYQHIEGKKESLYSNDIDCIAQKTKNEIIIASSGIIEKFDPKTEIFNILFHLNQVSQIVVDNNNNIWFGTRLGLGLFKYDSHSNLKKFYYSSDERNFPQDISSMFKSFNGSIWIGTSGGEFFLFDPVSEIISSFDLNIIDGIKKIFEDDSGLLWIGTQESGLFCYDPKNNTTARYIFEPKNEKSISSNTIFAINQDNKRTLWIGTNTGLNKYDPSSHSFLHFTEKNGLANNIVLALFEDNQNNLWLSTPKGISKFSLTNFQFKNYFFPYQLSNIWFIQPPGYKTADGEMYFGGTDGLIRFHPDSINDNSYVPPIVITAFKKFNQDAKLNSIISEKKSIELSYYENNISFEFAALNYSLSQKNQYAYKLEGLDKDWVYSGTRRFASYPNLDPGEYVFRVKGSNNDGVWNEEGTSIAIIISPPFWKTLWAYSLYAGIFILALYWIRRYEMNRISYKNQAKLDRAVLIEKEETEKIKSKFFANISHEFRTPLTLILGPAEKIEKNESSNPVKDAGIITRNSKRLLQLVNQLLDLSKLDAGKLKLEASSGNIISFVKGLALSFESLSESRDVMIKIKSDKEFIEVYFDREKMVKVFSNLLSNAFKFTPERGNVVITISQTSNSIVEIRVRNSGIGIPKVELPKLFDRFYQVDSSQTKEYEGTGIGLALVKELIELHHGSISVESKEAEPDKINSAWTEFTINLPLGRVHLKDDEILVAEKEVHKEVTPIDEAEYMSPRTLVESDPAQDETKTTILVVEDNYDMREYIKESLSDSYAIEEAINGEQGVRKAETIIPDLIISDLMMPKMDGNELTRILKNDERTSHIPIIILTAKSGQESKIEGLQTGADDYLTKPFDVNELRVRVENLINIRKKLQEKFSKGEFLSKRVEKKLKSIDEKFLAKVIEVIEKHLSEEEFSIEECSSEVGLSRTHFHKKLRALVGKSPSQYLRTVRLHRAKQMIEEEKGNVSEVAYSVGFSSPAYFSRCFKEEFGYPPSNIII
jgi:signal transduction histidine kinase/ligand-binding sensor domain-containing protein/DNA-binding response OmpR family regulator